MVPGRSQRVLPVVSTFLTAGFLAFAAGACGSMDGGARPAPRFVAGGGVSDGPIAGLLNVYVADEDTRAPLAGATVRVGASADPAPCTAVTDSTGLAVIEGATCMSLRGKQSVTVSAPGYAPGTLIGVNATNITAGIRPLARAAIDTATVSGTIAGWSSLPAPASGHGTLGIVSTSQTRELGDRANEIAQGTRSVSAGILGSFDVPANACVRNVLVDDCAWQLTTRTGAQAHYAVILDQDTRGTPDDDSDDTFTVIGWAIKTGLSFAKGATASGESLALLADTEMQGMTVSLPSAPAGLDEIRAFPMLDLGADGRIPIIVPALDATHTTTRVPKLAGALSSGRYDLLAQAQDAPDKDKPSTLGWVHGIDPSATVAVPAWLSPPGALSVVGGTYSFTATPGATLHTAEIEGDAGDRAWSITIFDGSTSFTLPGLTPDPLPAGMVRFNVDALLIPGIDLANVAFDDARERISALASNQIVLAP